MHIRSVDIPGNIKKVNILGAMWFMFSLAFAGAVAAVVYESTGGLERCYWGDIDSGFCYSVAALRSLDGLPSGFVEHAAPGVGLPLVQFLVWSYALASKAGLLSEPSFYGLASHPDPLLHLRQFVIAGWLFSSIIYLMVVSTVFWFARFMTKSNVISFLTSLTVAVSWSNLQFLLRIREDALSAGMGVLSLYLAFRALRSPRLFEFCVYLAASGTALAFSLFAKRNAMPYLAFVPMVALVVSGTPLDRTQAGTRSAVLKYALMANLLLFPPLVLLLRYWPEFIASFNLWLVPYLAVEILGFILMIALYVLFISCVRLYKSYGRGQMLALLRRGSGDAMVHLLLLMLGFELAVYASFVYPRVNVYSLFLIAVLVAGSVLAVTVGRRGQAGLIDLMRKLPFHRWVSGNTGYMILAAIVWGALWQLARASPEAFGAHIEVAVSRVLFEILHPQSSMIFLSSGDDPSLIDYLGRVARIWWGYYRGSRLMELLLMVLTLFELLRARNIAAVRAVSFLMLAGMGLLFFSSLRYLFPFYHIYADLLTVLAVSLCISHLIGLLRVRIGHARAMIYPTTVLCLGLALVAISGVNRIHELELRGMQLGAVTSRCDAGSGSERGCSCNQDASTKYGGTGLKEIIEQQYGAECMQAVPARAEQRLP